MWLQVLASWIVPTMKAMLPSCEHTQQCQHVAAAPWVTDHAGYFSIAALLGSYMTGMWLSARCPAPPLGAS